MHDLWKNELTRFKPYALIAGALFFCFLIMQSATNQPPMANDIDVLMYTAIAMLLGFAIGCVQMFSYKRKNHWTFLVHRPLSINAIFFALVRAAGVCLVLAITLPLTVLFIGLDLLNIDIVELRHYLFIVHLSALAIACYFLAIYTVLSPSWGAILSGTTVFYFMMSSDPAAISVTLMVDIIGVLLIGFLAKRSFKVDLSSHLRGKAEILVATATMHVAILGALMFCQVVFYHLPLTLLDKHPDNYDKAQLNDYFAILWQLDTQELVDYVVDPTIYPEKDQLIKQVKLAKEDHIRVMFTAPAIQGQMLQLDKSYALEDRNNKTRWFYSHQHGVFIGKHSKTRELVGYLTPNEFLPSDATLATLTPDQRFNEVPRVIGKYIQGQNTVYVVDFDEKYIEIKHQLPKGEHYITPLQWTKEVPSAVLVSNQKIYFFNQTKFDQDNSYSEPQTIVRHPQPLRKSYYISFYDLIDGYLVNYYDTHYYGFELQGTSLVYAKHDSSSQLVGEKSFKGYRPLPELVHDQEYWISPIAHGIAFEYLESLFKHANDYEHRSLSEIIQLKRSSSLYLSAIIATAICLLLVWWLSGRIALTNSLRWYWLAIVLFFGVVGFVSFVLLNRWREAFAQNVSKARERYPTKNPAMIH